MDDDSIRIDEERGRGGGDRSEEYIIYGDFTCRVL